MGKIVSKITIQAVCFVFIAIIGLMAVNKAVYQHQHILADGSIVTHAHPFSKSSDTDPVKSHKHSNLELLVLSNSSLFTAIVCFSYIAGLGARKFDLKQAVKRNYRLQFISIPTGRAPPCFW